MSSTTSRQRLSGERVAVQDGADVYQTHLLTHTSQLAHRLTFFMFLESAQRLLNTPASTLVLSPDFLPMLQRLDECIGYLEQHVSCLLLIGLRSCPDKLIISATSRTPSCT